MVRPATAVTRIVSAVLYMAQSSRPSARVVRGRLLEIAASGPSVSAIGATWADTQRVDPAPSFWPLAA